MMEKFAKDYLELLTGEFSSINLTRIDSFEEFYNKQILDSVEPLKSGKTFKDSLQSKKILLDIGFGGGFPILPLAFMNPELKFIGFDARAKKAEVVGKIAEKLSVQNVKLFHHRFEDVEFDKSIVVTFKAVGKVSDLLPLFCTKEELNVYFYKGPNFYELENLKTIEKDWELIEESMINIPGTEGRLLLGFKNKNVLRGTKLPKNTKFSTLL
jgi:16S rRNA (guanine527-N7)-methyltransferase